MRLLIIADSHGKEMGPVLSREIRHVDPNMTLTMFHVVRGRSISVIRGDYRKKLEEIRRFAPEKVLIHAGHNNMVRHNVYNRSPAFITAVVHMIMELVTEVRASFPSIKVYVSTLLPRTASRDMATLQAAQYNRLAKRFGQHMLTNQEVHNYTAVLNRPFWLRISLPEPNAELFAPDGLHVTNNGREVLA
jgi:hypothetical protein